MMLGLSRTSFKAVGLRNGKRAAQACLISLAALGLAAGCVEQADDKPTDEDLSVIKKNLLSEAPKPQFPAGSDVDGKVTYIGLDSSMNPIEPGKEVKLTHYWKVTSAPGAGWRLFTHLHGPGNSQYMNVDHGPI